jgi:hypothetical protein
VDFPGNLATRVLDGGPFEPSAAVVVEFAGAASEVYARDSDGQLWRVERRRSLRGRLAERMAIQLPPGKYGWVGFTRWDVRERHPRVFRALDLSPVPFEVRADRVNFAGTVRTALDVPRGRLPTRRLGGWREVEPGSFGATLQVVEPTERDFGEARRAYRWLRRSSLPMASALTGPADGEAPAQPEPSPAPVPESWGVRPPR